MLLRLTQNRQHPPPPSRSWYGQILVYHWSKFGDWFRSVQPYANRYPIDTRPLSEHDREVGSRVGRGKGKNPGNFLHERGSICPEKIKKTCLHPAEGGHTLFDKYRVLITISTECWKGISNANYELRTKTKTKTKNSFTLTYTREIRTTENTEDTEEFHTKTITITKKLLYTLFRSARDYNNTKTRKNFIRKR